MTVYQTKTPIPNFVFKDKIGTWHRMDNENPTCDKSDALTRKKEICEEKGRTGFRIVKHNLKYYLYERKN